MHSVCGMRENGGMVARLFRSTWAGGTGAARAVGPIVGAGHTTSEGDAEVQASGGKQ